MHHSYQRIIYIYLADDPYANEQLDLLHRKYQERAIPFYAMGVTHNAAGDLIFPDNFPTIDENTKIII